METLKTLLLILGSGSFAALSFIVYRAGARGAETDIPRAAEILQPRVTRLADRLMLTTRRGLALISLFFLLVGRRVVSLTKVFLHKLEKKFSFLIEAVRGRRPPTDQHGAASFFLAQVKAHHDEWMSQHSRSS